MKAKSMFKKFKGFLVGPGGMKCPCCCPAPSTHKMYFRQGRKQFDRWLERIERIEAQDKD